MFPKYCVHETDRILLNWEQFSLTDEHQSYFWLTRHLPGRDGFRFACFYIRMKDLIDDIGVNDFSTRYMEYSGSKCTPTLVNRWTKHLQKLELDLEEAEKAGDIEKISKIKMKNHDLPSRKESKVFP